MSVSLWESFYIKEILAVFLDVSKVSHFLQRRKYNNIKRLNDIINTECLLTGFSRDSKASSEK